MFPLGHIVAIAVEDSDVDAGIGEPLLHLPAGSFQDLELNARKAAAKFLEQTPDNGEGDRWQGAQRDAPCQFACLALDFPHQLLGIRQQGLDLREDAQANVRQGHAASGAVEQPRAAIPFQGVELAAEQ
ncbi:hypothetical protein D9M73_58290 [compost metagenome]